MARKPDIDLRVWDEASEEATAALPQKEINRVYKCIYATIYGHAVGDALGLLTESLTKEDAKKNYGCVSDELELVCKRMVVDRHREQWEVGDWTDDTDMLIVLIKCLVENMGQIPSVNFAKMMMEWSESGFPELGDKVAKGLCPHFKSVINHPQFSEQPEKAAEIVWRMKGNYVASNAILAFSPILGIHYYNILGKVIKNTLLVCDILIPDSRCQAGGVALSVTLAMLIQRDPKHLKKSGEYNINAIISDVFDYASKLLSLDAEVRELQSYMYNSSLKQLQLNEPGKTRYIFKTVGVAMWALKQKDFRKALQEIVMEGGDADANAAAAGAVLGCKMGLDAIPKSWIDSLLHRTWLDSILDDYSDQVQVCCVLACFRRRWSQS
ncbi:ADP-ribosylarginine hydrolase Tri1 [Octopus bimaculoides]|uniref:ADP-ribosylarginine hydrolase Tri1 n=1 Tax=Octopus bimaculoides TaxID=37653 RepID=UPI0022E8A675|nr:ADP-ribosylarginine hydrolase Tri1 [Octopus bimaculoides]